ncbi:MAG: POTRA domain-containing protein [Candidatus Hydrothermales bacterium]
METFFVYLIFSLPIREIEVKGLTPELEKKIILILKKYKEKESSKSNLDKLTQELSTFFLKEGYPTARIKFLGFEEKENGLKIIIKVSELNLFIVDDIIIDKNVKTKKSIFKRFFNFKNKPFKIEEFERSKEKIQRFGFIRIKGFELRKSGTFNYLYIDVIEKPSNSFEFFTLYDNKIKKFTGKLELNISNIFGDLRQFLLNWERFAEGRSNLELKYGEPFIGSFDISFSPFYSIFQRESLYIKENVGFTISYYFDKGIFSFIYNYFEEMPFLKSSKFINSSGSEISFGKKSFSPSNLLFFSIKGIILKGKKVSHKATLNFFVMRNLIKNFYPSLEILQGFIDLKDTLFSEYFFLGGSKYPRGFKEEEFVADFFSTFILENYIKFKNFSLFIFSDYSIIKLISNQNLRKMSYGLGFLLYTLNNEVKISFALPHREKIQTAKVHFTFKNYF